VGIELTRARIMLKPYAGIDADGVENYAQQTLNSLMRILMVVSGETKTSSMGP
jgi:hypothetical protein